MNTTHAARTVSRANKMMLRPGQINPRLVELKPTSELENHDRVASLERARQVHRIRRGKTVLVPVRELVYGSLFVAGLTVMVYTACLVLWVV